MGFFATFCGFLYNDFASIPIEYQHSCSKERENDSCQYYFGIDHGWYSANN